MLEFTENDITWFVRFTTNLGDISISSNGVNAVDIADTKNLTPFIVTACVVLSVNSVKYD